jgi:neutral ceramidase
MTLRFLFSLAVLTALAPGGMAASAMRGLKAGAATSNITPRLGLGIVGNGEPPPSTHIHDELHARCLVLDDGKTRLGFVVVDNVGVSRDVFDEAKRRIQAKTSIPAENLMMSATHTHSAVSARGGPTEMPQGKTMDDFDDYQKFLVQRIVDGVQRSVNNLEPARIGWGAGKVPNQQFNRRWLFKDGKTVVNPFGGTDRVLMNPFPTRQELVERELEGPAGPTNPEVYFISVQSTAGRPISVLINYWLHYVGGGRRGHISADYFAVVCDRVQQLLGADRQSPPFVGLLANGPCGDVNNVNFGAPPEKNAPYEKMRKVAEDVAQEVVRVHRTLEFQPWVELKSAQQELMLKTRRPDAAVVQRAKKIMARPDTVSPIHRGEKSYAQRTLTAAEWPYQVGVIIQAFRIGGLGVAAIPFEVFTATGLTIKAKSPFKDTFTIELANGGYGYLPTPEQHELGGYETWLGTNRVEKEASRKIEAKVLELFGQLQP